MSAPAGLLPNSSVPAATPGRISEKHAAAVITPAPKPSITSSQRAEIRRMNSAGSAPSAVASAATPDPAGACPIGVASELPPAPRPPTAASPAATRTRRRCPISWWQRGADRQNSLAGYGRQCSWLKFKFDIREYKRMKWGHQPMPNATSSSTAATPPRPSPNRLKT